MTTQIQRRRGTTTEHGSFTGAVGEITIDTTKDTVVVHDGSTTGGHPLAKENNPSFTGNVGVGTTTPSSKLEVHRGTISLNATTSSDTTKLRWNYQGTEYQYIERDNATGGLAFGDNTSERMRIDTSGNVGIGTTSPTSLGSGFKEVIVSGDTEGAGLQLQDTDGNVKAGLFTSDISGAAYVRTITNHPLAFRTNNTERLRINSSGLVGIANTNPQTLLSLLGGYQIGWNHATNGTKYAEIYADTSSNLIFRNTNSQTERLRIDSSGNVGVGTSSPGRTLDVTGTARISSVLTMGSYIQGTTQLDLYGDASSSSGLRLDSSGKVGIGTTSPASLLDVNSGATGATAATFVTNPKLGIGGDIFFEPGSGNDVEIYNYRSTAMKFGTQGAERMRIDGSGNVGIGTSSPNNYSNFTTLTLNGTTGGVIDFENNGNLVGEIYNDASTLKLVASASKELTFSTNGANERMRIDSSGRLLVGTTTARATGGSQNRYLQVEGTSYSTAGFSLTCNSTSNAPTFNFGRSRGTSIGSSAAVQDGDDLGFITWSAADGTDLVSYSAGINAEIDGTTGSNNTPGRLIFQTTAPGNAGLSERMRIDSSGRVGIGTTSPGRTLDVNGVIRSSGTSAALAFGGNSSTPAEGVAIHRPASDTMAFVTNNAERMRIDSSGNVGIGTTSPARPLSVSSSQIGARFTSTSSDSQIEVVDSSGTVVYGSASGNAIVQAGGTERMRIDSSGRLLVGTSSSINFIGGTSAGLQAINTSTQYALGMERATNDTAGPVCVFRKTRSTTNGGNTVVNSGDALGHIRFAGTDGSSAVSSAEIKAEVDGNPGSNDMPGRLVFSTTADSASSPTERVRISNTGDVYLRRAEGTERVYFTNSGAGSIGTASYAASSTTLYIGNAAIQVSSDVRLKDNIEDTKLDALDALTRINVKDFTWNDPTDTSFNNRNARGKWTGLIAQELVEVLPFVVNAPRKEEDGTVDYDSEERWLLDQSQLCPVLIKAIQQQQEIITGLEARLATLEAQ